MTTTRTPVRRRGFGGPALRSILPVALSLVAACATGVGAERPAHQIVVEVVNDLVPPRSVTIQMLASDRVTRTLGTVGAGETRRFSFRERLLGGAYRMTARIDQGNEMASEVFTLFPNAHVFWDLRRNLLTVGSQGGM
ncbi:MAG: hypothetical protein ABR527_11580 [Gemmatimonadota bacterium]